MFNSYKLIIAILLLICHSVFVYSIHCYACESVYDQDCAEDFEPMHYFQVDCARVAPPRYMIADLDNKTATGCMKMLYKVGNAPRIVRSCFFGDTNDTSIGCQLDPTLLNIENVECHVCANEKYCNGSATISIALYACLIYSIIHIIL